MVIEGQLNKLAKMIEEIRRAVYVGEAGGKSINR